MDDAQTILNGALENHTNLIKQFKGQSKAHVFLDAPSYLYKRVCLSVGPSVRPSPVIFGRVLGASCAVYPALFNVGVR